MQNVEYSQFSEDDVDHGKIDNIILTNRLTDVVKIVRWCASRHTEM
jgi:hypothetical protein